MGTSTSFRAPPTPRWQAFVAALESGAPTDRLCSELFNAGIDWAESLGQPATSSFAVTLVEAFSSLPDRLLASDRVELALSEFVNEARAASFQAGFTPALGLAERAFTAVVIKVVSGGGEIDQLTPQAAAASWTHSRGDQPGALVSLYLGELAGQFARHAVTREAGRLLKTEEPQKVSVTRSLAEELASSAMAMAQQIEVRAESTDTLREEWADQVSAVFDRGRQLPRGDE